MEGASWDSISQYFEIGGPVEISSNEEGFRGSWYAGTLLRRPKRKPNKVEVEYTTLMEDEAGTRPLREVLELVQIRPPPPRESRLAFEPGVNVDAYYNDGWWEGVITEEVGEDRYEVLFRGSREKLTFVASELRLHREWDYGKWVPPLKESPDAMHANEKTPFSADPKKEVIEHSFSPGELVEVCSDDEGFQGAWFAATVIESINKDKYLIEYENLRNDDDTNLLREEVDGRHVRPCPPDIGLVDRFELHEEVDALYNDCWWVGMISKVLKNDRYTVYFRNTDEELKFEHYDLRVHQEWRGGKWHVASKVLNL